MNKKLTLSIKEDLVKFAHEYSKRTRQSISALFEAYLRGLKKQELNSELSIQTSRLYGILSDTKLPEKKEILRQFHEKSMH